MIECLHTCELCHYPARPRTRSLDDSRGGPAVGGLATTEPSAARAAWPAEVDARARPGLISDERERLRAIERENRELRRANDILRAASASFARELDPPPPR